MFDQTISRVALLFYYGCTLKYVPAMILMLWFSFNHISDSFVNLYKRQLFKSMNISTMGRQLFVHLNLKFCTTSVW